ncbi:MAG: hypothetical protein OHK005_16530 [Candidatus Methylacidiphilales bacterium]
MSITVIREGETIRILAVDGDLPEGQPIQFFSREEVELQTAATAWGRMAEESRKGMVLQAQAKYYQDWMDESEWEEWDCVRNSVGSLPLTDFKP